MPEEANGSDPQADTAEVASPPPFWMRHQRKCDAWEGADDQMKTNDGESNCNEQRRQRPIAAPKRYAGDRKK
jgi:hypothetical protein